MLIDAVCSLGSDAAGRVVVDTGYLVVCPQRRSVRACHRVGLGIVLEKLVGGRVPFAFRCP